MTPREARLVRVVGNTALFAVLVALVDHAAQAVGARFDLTEDRRHTLSPVSRDTVRALERDVTATVYVSLDLDPPYHTHKDAIVALLDELAAASRGRFAVRVTDPVDAGATEAKARGIAPITYRFASADRAEAKSVYLGVALASGDKEAVLSPITSLDTLEYDVVRALRQLVAKDEERPVLGWFVGDGAPDLTRARADSALGRLRDELAATHEVRAVPLGDGAAGGVPEDVDALIVAGPVRPLPEGAIYALDQFVERGGALGLFVTTARPDLDALAVAEADGGLSEFAAHLGVQIGPGLVVDRAQRDVLTLPVPAGDRVVRVAVEHPLMPIVTTLSAQSPINRGVGKLTIPFAAPLSLVDPPPPGVDGRVIASSSATSAAVTGVTSLRPEATDRPVDGERPGPFPMAVALTGSWRTLFDRRAVPGDGAGQVFDGAPARVLVVASSDVVANEPAWVENAVDWLLADPALTEIRARDAGPPPLRPLTTTERTGWKAAMTLGPLALVGLLAGLTAWRQRAR